MADQPEGFLQSLARCQVVIPPGPMAVPSHPRQQGLIQSTPALEHDRRPSETPPPEIDAAIWVLSEARQHRCPPPADALAQAITTLCSGGGHGIQFGHSLLGAGTPVARAKLLADCSPDECRRILRGQTLLQEMEGWRKSGAQYASAVRLWGRLARAVQQPDWPPSAAVLDALVVAVANGNALVRYCSHIRSALRSRPKADLEVRAGGWRRKFPICVQNA